MECGSLVLERREWLAFKEAKHQKPEQAHERKRQYHEPEIQQRTETDHLGRVFAQLRVCGGLL